MTKPGSNYCLPFKCKTGQSFTGTGWWYFFTWLEQQDTPKALLLHENSFFLARVWFNKAANSNFCIKKWHVTSDSTLHKPQPPCYNSAPLPEEDWQTPLSTVIYRKKKRSFNLSLKVPFIDVNVFFSSSLSEKETSLKLSTAEHLSFQYVHLIGRCRRMKHDSMIHRLKKQKQNKKKTPAEYTANLLTITLASNM